MKTFAIVLAVCSAVVVSSRGASAQMADRGAELGLRLGYGVPMGQAQNGTNLDSAVTGAVPVILEAGFRVDANLLLGLFFQYGIAQIKDSAGVCDNSGNSCSASSLRLGVQGIYRFLPEHAFAPWAGLGAGYEWLNRSFSSSALANLSGSQTYRGIEMATLQVGGDFRSGPSVVIGPFASLSIGRFSHSSGTLSLAGATGTGSGDINETGIHTWVMFGVRGAYNP